MQHFQTERRLAAILAIDLAGYSGRAEADEAAAVGVVAELAEIVSAAAAAQDGRVFNTAGDGFMLEFPSASGALAAAEAIIAQAPAPVRAGLHLGEVTATASGDLLGHGVNVAARLQQMAAPGEILVSDELRRAARGPSAERMAPLGRVRLAKMKETGAVFSLTADGSAGRRRRRMRLAKWAGAAAGLALLIAGGMLAWRVLPATAADPLTVAVRDFEAPGAPGAVYGTAVADRMAAALADRQIPTISRARARRGDLDGARLVFGGGVEQDGPLYRIRVQLDDAKAGLTLWTATYERPAAEATALQDQAAAAVADLAFELRDDLGPEGRKARPEVLAAYAKALGLARLNRGNFEATREAYRDLVKLAPESARAHATYAYASAGALRQAHPSPEIAAAWRAEAVAEAQKALELAPKDAIGYIALFVLRPDNDLIGRGALLDKALTLDADSGRLATFRGDFIRAVGRPREALPLTLQGFTADAGRPAPTAGVIFALSGMGRYPEARAFGERGARTMPNANSVRRANLFTALLYGTPDQASAAIDGFQIDGPPLDPASEKAWRDYVAARRGRLPAAVAARELTQAPRAEAGVDASTAFSAFVVLGRLDEAFAELERAREQGLELHLSNLFEQAAAPVLRDPRFMPMAARLGLVDYWLKSDRWPEYCQAPDTPYDCRSEAAKAARSLTAAPG